MKLLCEVNQRVALKCSQYAGTNYYTFFIKILEKWWNWLWATCGLTHWNIAITGRLETHPVEWGWAPPSKSGSQLGDALGYSDDSSVQEEQIILSYRNRLGQSFMHITFRGDYSSNALYTGLHLKNAQKVQVVQKSEKEFKLKLSI